MSNCKWVPIKQTFAYGGHEQSLYLVWAETKDQACQIVIDFLIPKGYDIGSVILDVFPTLPTGIEEDATLLGDVDTLAKVFLDIDAQITQLQNEKIRLKRAISNTWPLEGEYAVLADALFQRDGFPTYVSIVQRHI